MFLDSKFVVAPMVEQSELAWRILSRRYGADLVYAPMVNSKMYINVPERTRKQMFDTIPQDRPLIVQFCGDDPEIILKAASLVTHQCDAIDLNLGCPQHIAKKGHYGAYLQDEWNLISQIVSTLNNNNVPTTCKIRVFNEVSKTVQYAQMIEHAGCAMIAVHGRTREQKGQNTGVADWSMIKAIKENLNIPVLANGNILKYEDVFKCMEYTKADGVMVAEANLHNPAFFSGKQPFIWDIAVEYLDICEIHFPNPSCIRAHLFRLFRSCINDYPDVRTALTMAHTLDEFRAVVESIKIANPLKCFCESYVKYFIE